VVDGERFEDHLSSSSSGNRLSPSSLPRHDDLPCRYSWWQDKRVIEWSQVLYVIWKILGKLYGLSCENGYWRIKMHEENYNKFKCTDFFFL